MENITKYVQLFAPAQHFFLLNNAKKKLYANAPEIFNFNPKQVPENILSLSVVITFSVLMLQISTAISVL
jgi:hypothetical protein